MDEKEILEWVGFVTDKFTSNHSPDQWIYSRDTGGLKHIRYESDTTGWNKLSYRFKRFLQDITIDHFNPKGFWKEVKGSPSLWKKIKSFPLQIRVGWNVYVKLDRNMPDGTLANGIITHWEEDGEYIMMFNPTVGREVLKFINEQPNNEYAKAILGAMKHTLEVKEKQK